MFDRQNLKNEVNYQLLRIYKLSYIKFLDLSHNIHNQTIKYPTHLF